MKLLLFKKFYLTGVTYLIFLQSVKNIIILFISLIISLPACQKNDHIKPIDYKTLQAIAEENHVVGMKVLGYKDGDVRFIYNYGYADIDRKIKVDDDTIFLMASISKIVTGIAVMKLIEDGKINSIEDDISGYLGYIVRNPKYPDIPVTIRHLMTHTSGINDEGVSYEFIRSSYSPNPPSMKELFSPGGKYYNPVIWLNSPPGTTFEYSNFATILVGSIIGKVSGSRFDEYINKKILDPLGMRGGFTIQRVKNINKVAVIYSMDDNRIPYANAENYMGKKPKTIDLSEYTPGTNPVFLGPHGGLRTRAKGLAKIMEVFIEGGVYSSDKIKVRLLKETTVNLMLKPNWEGNGFYGLYKQKGLFIHITDDLIPGMRMYGHVGDAAGLLSAMYFSPQKKFGAIFVMNGGDHVPGKSGFYRIEEQVFRESYRLLFNLN
jgi:CubicO group peptidase (beta-lactamase class C family)